MSANIPLIQPMPIVAKNRIMDKNPELLFDHLIKSLIIEKINLTLYIISERYKSDRLAAIREKIFKGIEHQLSAAKLDSFSSLPFAFSPCQARLVRGR